MTLLYYYFFQMYATIDAILSISKQSEACETNLKTPIYSCSLMLHEFRTLFLIYSSTTSTTWDESRRSAKCCGKGSFRQSHDWSPHASAPTAATTASVSWSSASISRTYTGLYRFYILLDYSCPSNFCIASIIRNFFLKFQRTFH